MGDIPLIALELYGSLFVLIIVLESILIQHYIFALGCRLHSKLNYNSVQFSGFAYTPVIYTYF